MRPSLRPRRRLRDESDDDPFALLVNFFDCSVVFALGFVLAWAARAPAASGSPEVPAEKSVRAPLRETADRATGPGERLGVAYRLPGGDVVYVPDGAPR